jgi:riboflavin biosynthesis pyrimidine reductase
VRALFPQPGGDGCDLDDADLVRIYDYPRGRPWVRANFVSTVDGAAQGPDHRSGSISGTADRRMLALLRALADVVLVGAETARVERYGPADIRPEYAQIRADLGLPPTPPIALVTASLDVPERLLSDSRTLVITSEMSPPDRRAYLADRVDVAVVGDREVTAHGVIDALTSRGYGRIHCEGGPRLFGLLVHAGLIDELCLTVSPQLLAGPGLRILAGPQLPEPMPLRLATVLESDDFLFLRWLVRNS